MTALILYDDAKARAFEPFAATRPVSELRAGAMLVRERWEVALGARAAGFISAAHLADFEEGDAPVAWSKEIPAGAVLANSRFLPALHAGIGNGDAWESDGRLVAVRLSSALAVDSLREGAAALEDVSDASARREVAGRWIGEVWELITTLIAQLSEDIAVVGPTLDCDSTPLPAGGPSVIGTHATYLERGARIEPLTVLDVSAGPILVRAGAEVRAFTRLIGPCVIGPGSTILGDRVHACAIGDRALIRGEISESIVLGHSNKSHDGFVGHSYLGRWVNLGAGTTTSNLKNNYGNVALWTPDGVRDTGVMKLGTMFGDHVKTGIGLRLTTGSVIGAGSNIYGAAMPPSYVPPFSWGVGDRLAPYLLDKFLATTERAMSRRQVKLGAGARRQLAAAHALSRSAGKP